MTDNIEQQIPENQEKIRNEDGTFKKGFSGNPNGRPPGKSLKEYWKQRFAEMTDEEKEEFSKKVNPELLWQMAEGRPEAKSDITSKGEKIIPILANVLCDDNMGDDKEINE